MTFVYSICYYTTFLNLLSPKVAIRAIGTETKDQRQSGKGWPNIVAQMAGKPMGLPWAIYEFDRLTEWAFNHWTLPLNTIWPHWTLPHLSYFYGIFEGIFIPLILW